MFQLSGYLIVLARVSGILFLMPGFGARILPARFKLALSAVLSAVFFINLEFAVEDFYYLLATELIVGLFLGCLARILFESLSFLASIVSMQSGLASAHFFAPGLSEQSSILYTLLFLYATVGIFESSASHTFLKAIASSYERLPVGKYVSWEDFSRLSSFALNQSFLIAFKLSAPFLVLYSLLLVASGLLSRLAPSFQVFLLLNPMQNLLMFFMFALSLDKMISFVITATAEALHL